MLTTIAKFIYDGGSDLYPTVLATEINSDYIEGFNLNYLEDISPETLINLLFDSSNESNAKLSGKDLGYKLMELEPDLKQCYRKYIKNKCHDFYILSLVSAKL